MGIVEITCPDCGGQLHRESFVGSQGNGKDSYSKYFCVGDSDYHKGFDAASDRGFGCGFMAKSKGSSEDKTTTVKSDELDYWSDWVEYRDEFN